MGTKTDMMVKVVLVFFISLLSFSIGTFVGKKFSDNQHQMAQLEGGRPSHSEEARSVASDSSNQKTETLNKKENLTDDEIAKLAEEFIEDEDSDHKSSKEAPADHKIQEPTHEIVKKEVDHEQKNEKNDSNPEKPLMASKEILDEKIQTHKASLVEKHESKKEMRTPSSLPKNAIQYSVGKFTVQVASYSSEDEAIKLASSLKKKGLEAYYIPATINGKNWYRVSVGQFATVNEAKEFRKELLHKKEVSSAIVLKITK